MKITFPEIKLMVTLVKSELPFAPSPQKILEKVCERFGIILSLQDIYQALDMNFDEDFERESNKIKYYG